VPELGLVCITASDAVRYRTITRKRLLQLEAAAQQKALRALYAENLRRLGVAIDFCQAQQIQLYRLHSATFPFADDPVGESILTEFTEGLAANWRSRFHAWYSIGVIAVAIKVRTLPLSAQTPSLGGG
jgi:UV DNA damage endonuclease